MKLWDYLCTAMLAIGLFIAGVIGLVFIAVYYAIALPCAKARRPF